MAVKKLFENASEGVERGRELQKMENAMQEWMSNGMKGSPPYTQEQMQQARQGVINSAADTAVSGTGVPGTSMTPGMKGPGNIPVPRK